MTFREPMSIKTRRITNMEDIFTLSTAMYNMIKKMLHYCKHIISFSNQIKKFINHILYKL